MAVKLVEGFDHLMYSLLSVKGWTETVSGVGAVSGSLQTGRITGYCVRITGPGNNGSLTRLTKSLPSSYSTVVIGVAFKANVFTDQTREFIRLLVSGTANVGIAINSSNKLIVTNGAGTALATGTTTVTTGAWYYIELKAFANGASGTVELHLNGVTEIASTTANIGSSAMNGIDIGAVKANSISHSLDFDDIYVADTSGSAPNNTFLGEVTVETKMPTSDGATQDFVPDTGSTHYTQVDEQSGTFPDGDTSYVSTPSTNKTDTYGLDDLGVLAGSVFAVQTNIYARKDDVGTRSISDVIRQGGTNFPSASPLALLTTYALKSEIHETDTASAAWTIASVNAAEFGAKVT